MLVKELIEKLQQLDPESSVVIVPKNDNLIYPNVSVVGAISGFDWYQGMVILGTEKDLFLGHEAKSKSQYRRLKEMGVENITINKIV